MARRSQESHDEGWAREHIHCVPLQRHTSMICYVPLSYRHSGSLYRPLGHFYDLAFFLHFCRSSASLTHVVSQSQSILQCRLAMFFLACIAILHLPLNCTSYHVRAYLASWWYGQTIVVSLDLQLPEVGLPCNIL